MYKCEHLVHESQGGGEFPSILCANCTSSYYGSLQSSAESQRPHHLAAGGSYWSLLLWFMLGWQFMPASANHICCWVYSFERSIAKEELISGRTKLFRKATLCAKQNWSVHKLGAHLVDMSKFLGLVRGEVGSKQALCSTLSAQNSAGSTCRCARH